MSPATPSQVDILWNSGWNARVFRHLYLESRLKSSLFLEISEARLGLGFGWINGRNIRCQRDRAAFVDGDIDLVTFLQVCLFKQYHIENNALGVIDFYFSIMTKTLYYA